MIPGEELQKRCKEMERRIEVMSRFYDLDGLCAHPTGIADIAAYYKASDFFYNTVHAGGGHHIHMGLSEDGEFHMEDYLGQARFVSSLMGSGCRRVLELGAGQLSNTRFLAEHFPDTEFWALDLPERNFLKNRVPGNVRLAEGDYHDLSRFEEGFFDIVFGVETVCHSHDKKRIFGECRRVLRPGGQLVLFDVYEPKPKDEMSGFERYVSRLTLAAMRVTDEGQYIGDTLKWLSETGFEQAEAEDLTEKIRPTLRRLERLSGAYFRRPKAVKVLRKLIQDDATMNSIAGWLMQLSFDGENIHRYGRVTAVRGL